MRVDMCADMRADMRADMWVDVLMDIGITHACRHVLRGTRTKMTSKVMPSATKSAARHHAAFSSGKRCSICDVLGCNITNMHYNVDYSYVASPPHWPRTVAAQVALDDYCTGCFASLHRPLLQTVVALLH